MQLKHLTFINSQIWLFSVEITDNDSTYTALLQLGNEAKTGRQNAETAEFIPSFPGRQNVTRQSWHLLGRALLAAILESPGKDGDPKRVISNTDILRSYWVPRKKIGINGCGKLS